MHQGQLGHQLPRIPLALVSLLLYIAVPTQLSYYLHTTSSSPAVITTQSLITLSIPAYLSSCQYAFHMLLCSHLINFQAYRALSRIMLATFSDHLYASHSNSAAKFYPVQVA